MHIVIKYGHRMDESCLAFSSYQASSMANSVGGNGGININAMRNAFLATLEMVMDLCWFVDSGATSHLTSKLGNLNLNPDYKEKGKLMIGDGKLLPITHIGSSILPNSSLKLENVLRIPTIAKTLVNISRLTTDNNVFVEFHSNVCFVKDQVTGNKVLKGSLKMVCTCLMNLTRSNLVLH